MRAGKDLCPSSETIRLRDKALFLPHPFILIRPSGLDEGPHTGESALLSGLILMLLSPRNTLTDTPRILSDRISGHLMAQSS